MYTKTNIKFNMFKERFETQVTKMTTRWQHYKQPPPPHTHPLPSPVPLSFPKPLRSGCCPSILQINIPALIWSTCFLFNVSDSCITIQYTYRQEVGGWVGGIIKDISAMHKHNILSYQWLMPTVSSIKRYVTCPENTIYVHVQMGYMYRYMAYTLRIDTSSGDPYHVYATM